MRLSHTMTLGGDDMRPRILGLLTAGILFLASCAGPGSSPQDANGNPASSPQPPTDSPASSATPPSAEASPEACPYNDSPCLGPLAAGTYHTGPRDQGFWFQLQYTVPDGWVNSEDYQNSFDLRYAEYSTNIGRDGRHVTAGIAVFLDMGTASPDDPCHEIASDHLTVDEWVEVLTNDPDVVASDPQAVTIGGLEGVSLEVAISPEYSGTCFFGAEVRTKGFLLQVEQAGTHRGFAEVPQRVVFLDTPGGSTITILVERIPEDAYRAFLEGQALPVIESFVFDQYH